MPIGVQRRLQQPPSQQISAVLHTRLRSLHPAPKEFESVGSERAAIESCDRHCVIESWNHDSRRLCGIRKPSRKMFRVVYELSGCLSS